MSISLESLRLMSARLGHNADLIQAGGGNTSVKIDGTLWVKASGKWLIHAADEEMFLPVPLDLILASIDRNEEFNTEFAGMRPSVETTLHAVIPALCVIHVHSVNALAWASIASSPQAVAPRLEGIRWEWIPYIHPGLPLAQRIREALRSSPDVLLLQNHGLIVAGESCEAAEDLLYEVERRIDLPMRNAAEANQAILAEYEDAQWQIAEDSEVHTLGADPVCCAIAAAGTMYPDHCVYLGHAVAIKRNDETASQASARYESEQGRRPPVLLCTGLGVLTATKLSTAAREMLICLARVVRRIPLGQKVQYLEVDQVARLMNWDAEHYRQAIAKQTETRMAR